ncbi:MAG: hypothetical protein DCC49_04895 [Acidobacteria bacterium]|nr:MAG: hypothetical protein DCC49_04895 [Acidobacteriota bacterium]
MSGVPELNDIDELLAGLDEEQYEAVTAKSRIVVVMAGAGSGKTRVLTRRIAYRIASGGAAPEKTLAVTFTRKAASELSERLWSLGVDGPAAGTFHSVALRTLKRRHGHRTPKILGSKASIISRVAGNQADAALVREVSREIDWAKARMIPPSRYLTAAADRATAIEQHTISAIYEKYEAEKERRGVIDFEDILLRVTSDLEQDPRFSAEMQSLFRHIYVDEFQDVNPLQYRMLSALMTDESDLFVVGDPAQAIFSFAGADPGYLTGLSERQEDVAVVRLTGNYRSTPEIVEIANSIPAAEAPAKLRPTLPEGAHPEIRDFADEEAEARGIARLLRDGYESRHGWRSSAVLYRIAAQSAPIEAALHDHGIPFTVRDGLFTQRPEVASALQRLKEADAAPGIALSGLVAEIAEEIAEGEDEKANLEVLLAMAEEYESIAPGAMGDAAEFAEFVRQSRETPARSGNSVTLLTLHSSKGLEFRNVIIAGCEDGLIPVYHSKKRAEIDEEQRLFYVGVTRAREKLTLTWARQRRTGQGISAREESPFLAGPRAALRALAQREIPTKDWGKEIAKQRSAIGKPHDADATD